MIIRITLFYLIIFCKFITEYIMGIKKGGQKRCRCHMVVDNKFNVRYTHLLEKKYIYSHKIITFIMGFAIPEIKTPVPPNAGNEIQ